MSEQAVVSDSHCLVVIEDNVTFGYIKKEYKE